MNNPRRSLLTLLTLVAAGLVGCDRSADPTSRPTADTRGRAAAAPAVEVMPAVIEDLPQRIPAVGTVYAAEETVVSSKVAGILIRTAVDVGQTLRPGDPLAGIEPANYEFALREAQAALDQTLAQLGATAVPAADFDIETVPAVRRAAAEVAAARFTYDRLQQMRGAGSERMVADQELSNARRDLDVAEANLSEARDESKALLATARQREATLQVAMRRLADASLEAPPIPSTLAALQALAPTQDALTHTNGDHPPDDCVWVVVDRFATEGQYINVAMPLYRLMVSDLVLLRAEVSQRFAGLVEVGLPVDIELPQGVRPVGHICRIRPAIDPLNRTYEVDVLVDTRTLRGGPEAAALKPGAFAKLTITTRSSDPVIWIPARAVRALAGVNKVFVFDADAGVVRAREVSVLRRAAGRAAVSGDIAPGEPIVVAGVDALSDGMFATLAARPEGAPATTSGAAPASQNVSP